MSHLPPLRLTGATILREGEMRQRSIAIAHGKITRGPLPAVDLSGYLILPGIIDLHGAALRYDNTDRPRTPETLAPMLAGAERDAAAAGITTAWIAQGWSWADGHDAPERAECLLAAVGARHGAARIDLRVLLMVQTHLVDSGERLINAIRHWKVDQVSFANDLERAQELAAGDPVDFAAWAAQQGCLPENLRSAIARAAAGSARVPRHLCRLAEAFDQLGVSYGSHGDTGGDTRETYSMIGARIARFPASHSAAAAAKAMNDPVVVDARGLIGTPATPGKAVPMDLLRTGLCDVLASGGQYSALAAAAFALSDQGLRTLPEAWAMISARPAEIMRLPDRGALDCGKRADLVIVNEANRRIEGTISGGRLAFLRGEVAARFVIALSARPGVAPHSRSVAAE